MPAAAPADGAAIAAVGHSVREVAGITGLSPAQIRSFVRAGLVEAVRDPRGAYRIAFQEIVLLRTARRLLDAAVPARRARRVLSKLKAELPESAHLTGVRITADGAQVVIRSDESVWNAESGQGHFDFAVDPRSASVAALPTAAAPVRSTEAAVGGEALSSDDWYNLGLDLESSAPDRAAHAYAESLVRDGRNADAHVNLGRLMQLVGRRREAARHYLEALRHDPAHELAHYNLGTVHDEQDLIDQAIACYKRAPGVPDAHYNLVRLYEILGDEMSAARHLRRHRELESRPPA